MVLAADKGQTHASTPRDMVNMEELNVMLDN